MGIDGYAITRLVSPAQRRYLLVEQGVGAMVFTFVLNAGIAWLAFRRFDVVPLWGDQSIAGDTIATGLLLPLITCGVVTALARREVRVGRIAPLGWTRTSHALLGWLPRRTWVRGLVLGAAGVVFVALPTVKALDALHVSAMGFGRFVLFKSTFAALGALVVSPAMVLWVLATAPADAAPVRRDSAA
jgi:hypothetical protein